MQGMSSPKKKESLLAKWRKNSSSSLGDDPDVISDDTGSTVSGRTPPDSVILQPAKGMLVRTGSSPDLVPRLRAYTTSGLSQSATSEPNVRRDKKEKKEKKHKKSSSSDVHSATQPVTIRSSTEMPQQTTLEVPVPTRHEAAVVVSAVPLKR